MYKDVVDSCYTTAALKALESFPVEVEHVEFIKHSENVFFRVSVCGRDTDFVLRLHRPDYNSIEELNSQRIWISALREAGMWVPGSLLTCEGQFFASVDIPETINNKFLYCIDGAKSGSTSLA